MHTLLPALHLLFTESRLLAMFFLLILLIICSLILIKLEDIRYDYFFGEEFDNNYEEKKRR